MVVPRSPYSPQFMRAEASRGPKEAVLAIGSQAVLRAPAAGGDRVTLTTDDGTTALATVKAGAAVEITAWRPRRSGAPPDRRRPPARGQGGGSAPGRPGRRPGPPGTH